MGKKLKLLIVAGARPNFMKIAPLIKCVRQTEMAAKIECLLVHTGQHYDEKMSHIFFEELGIPAPEINLEVGSGSHAVQTANIMIRFEPALLEHKPDWLVVVGDVNSTAACSLVAAKLGVKVAHLEAGLRSGDRTMPEEINRLVTDAIADLLLTPSTDADANLRREGVPDRKIRMVGNIMIDALVSNLDRARERQTLQRLQLEPGRFVYVTLHRPSNVDQKDSLAVILSELDKLSRQLTVVFPIHPRTRKMAAEFGLTLPQGSGMRLLEPVGYHDSLSLTQAARFVLTDSGGLQEESTFFRTPCLTLRPNTERPITVDIGSNRLTSVDRLNRDIGEVLASEPRLGKVPPFWDGKTAERTLQAILEAA
jgi:UDP-N-acetylglucosamine 2-epimerase (non-hydrolysing)